MLLINIKDKTFPAALTNHSLYMGKQLGLFPGSQLSDVVEQADLKWTVFLAINGLSKQPVVSFDDFLNVTWNPDELKDIHTDLIAEATEQKENLFAKTISKSIRRPIKSGEKKSKPLKLQIECVEDRYILYCLIYKIDEQIFWHYPISSVERIFEGIQSYTEWKSSHT